MSKSDTRFVQVSQLATILTQLILFYHYAGTIPALPPRMMQVRIHTVQQVYKEHKGEKVYSAYGPKIKKHAFDTENMETGRQKTDIAAEVSVKLDAFQRTKRCAGIGIASKFMKQAAH